MEIGAQAFGGCSSLKKITLSNGISSIDANDLGKISIGEGAFAGCASLNEIRVLASEAGNVPPLGQKQNQGQMH